METEQVSKIAEVNDAYRRGGFGVTITTGVRELEDVAGLLREVRLFDAFTNDNDPHGEHDFGQISWYGEKVFWKMDYYNQAMNAWCHPLSPKCRRIITVMLAEEY
jgi:hypothetical protein